MNYGIAKRRNFLAKEKNRGHRITVGFAGIADFRSFIGQEYIAGIQKAAVDYDLNFINFAGAIKYSFFDDINFINHYLKTFRFMKAPLVDGLVTWASSLCELTDSKTVEKNFNALKPLPMVDIGYLDIEGVPSVRIDNDFSISLMMQHLANEHKYTKFAFIGAESSVPHKMRLNCYKNELEKFSLPQIEDSIFFAKSMNQADIAEIIDEFAQKHDLHGKKEIECIVTPSDIVAAIAIEELDKLGISVPTDIAITGFNNQYSSVSCQCPITTLNLEYFKRGYASVELLIDKIMSPHEIFETRLVPTSIVVRQSCGCFEQSVFNSAKSKSDFSINEKRTISLKNGSESVLREFLLENVRQIFKNQTEKDLKELVDSIFDDMYAAKTPEKMLRWFQKLLQNARKNSHFANSEIQESITKLRQVIIPLVKDDFEQREQIENIFHQLRTLVSVFIEYDTIAPREDVYLMNNLSQIAIHFASATSGKQIQDVLRYQLGEMGIPGIILALSEKMTNDIAAASVELVIPEPPADIKAKLPHKILEPSFIPKHFFPQMRRYSFIVEILRYEDNYFGYAFLEIGNQNIAIYDTVRTLLSNALHVVYSKEGRTRQHTQTLGAKQLESILNIPNKNAEGNNFGLNSSQITNYLLEHLDEMTNLDKMASDLSVSKSHLVRKAKELTGFTIQTLHERLKIEQAKNLLQVESMKLTEIASRLGFQNQNYFSSVFKKNTGMSPRTWAKKYFVQRS